MLQKKTYMLKLCHNTADHFISKNRCDNKRDNSVTALVPNVGGYSQNTQNVRLYLGNYIPCFLRKWFVLSTMYITVTS